ncbi:hypothetical protein RHSIM_RhsimUnG0010000 [Rhododendron simsii]|uniref:Uncharacterized protein n=1 Tax=Rhododendron simsii TaxID=118357 RepID=A0A834FY26_RHOSS|nr:hypothetical protein RHSIM_RhsimUnG0010000 [Rhododendron simsii]
MWKLKVAEGQGPWLNSTNNFVGRQIWEFDSDAGTPEEREAVEKARDDYRKNRYRVCPSGDVLMRIQPFLAQILSLLDDDICKSATSLCTDDDDDKGTKSKLSKDDKEREIGLSTMPTPPIVAKIATVLVGKQSARTAVSVWSLKKENSNVDLSIQPVRLGEKEQVDYETVTTALRKAVRLNCAIQSKDGHWPAENAGPLLFTPPLLICLYISGQINTVLTAEHKKEMIRYLYNHQVYI